MDIFIALLTTHAWAASQPEKKKKEKSVTYNINEIWRYISTFNQVIPIKWLQVALEGKKTLYFKGQNNQ